MRDKNQPLHLLENVFFFGLEKSIWKVVHAVKGTQMYYGAQTILTSTSDSSATTFTSNMTTLNT